MAEAVAWWLALELLGLVALPFCLVLFHRLPDRGVAFAKPLGVLGLSYCLWLAASLGLLPNGKGSVALLLLLAAMASFLLEGWLWRRSPSLRSVLRQRWRYVVGVETLFLALFALWALVRAYNPEIGGTEKPMDFAFLNACLRSAAFPPADPWLAGYSISYYYFGYLMAAVVAQLAGVGASVAFNLNLATLYALAGVGAFGLVYNLVATRSEATLGARLAAVGAGSRTPAGEPETRSSGRWPIIAGLLATALVVGIGNLEGILEVMRAHGVGDASFWGWIGIRDLAQPYQSATWYPSDSWWWWRASRVIGAVADGQTLDYTINEFPSFSFVLGDMHPHVMALPYGLLFLALALNVALSSVEGGPGWLRAAWGELRANWPRYLATAVVLGGFGFLNAWDLPIYSLLFVTALWLAPGSGGRRQRLAVAAAVVIGGVALYAPFYAPMVIGFVAGGGGGGGLPLAPWLGPPTRPLHWLLVWGPLAFFGGAYLWLRGDRWTRWLLAAAVVVAAVAEVAVADAAGPVLSRAWPLLVVAAAFWGLWRQQRRPSKSSVGRFVWALLALATVLLAVVEFVYIRDVFGNRMNTVFKLYYQAWLLLAVGGAYAAYWIGVRLARSRWAVAWWAAAALVLAAGAVYPVAATLSKTAAFAGQPTLDGLASVAASRPAEARAIAWLAENVRGQPVIAEAVEGEWGEFSRVSARTGLPTILGWAGHEVQWRGSERPFAGREAEVARLYRSREPSEVTSLLVKYDIAYVYVGHLERAKYAPLGAFTTLLTPVFEDGDVVIYATSRQGR